MHHHRQNIHNRKASKRANIPQNSANLRVEKQEKQRNSDDRYVQHDLFFSGNLTFLPKKQKQHRRQEILHQWIGTEQQYKDCKSQYKRRW